MTSESLQKIELRPTDYLKGINFRRIKFSRELISAIWLNSRKLVLKNVFLRYRDFKIFGPILTKNDLFSFNISKSPLSTPVFAIFFIV